MLYRQPFFGAIERTTYGTLNALTYVGVKTVRNNLKNLKRWLVHPDSGCYADAECETTKYRGPLNEAILLADYTSHRYHVLRGYCR